jgi:4-diphosphocytidyl-2-C-methyl-D-erythritol kinase
MSESKTIVVKAPAKINLTFAIKGKMPDGYHEVETLMQSVTLEDELIFHIAPAEAQSMTLTWMAPAGAQPGVGQEVPADEKNLVLRAASLYLARTNRPNIELKVILKKNIPMAAGMGGGSSDAAATLVALNKYFGNEISSESLELMAQELGADVPFCVQGGTQIGRGRGDDLEQVDVQHKYSFCIIKPKMISIGTPWIYKEYDSFMAKGGGAAKIPLEEAVSALRTNDLLSAARSFTNAFTPIVFQHYPELRELEEQTLRLGALSCHMTGSGPTMVALCQNEEYCRLVCAVVIANDESVDVWVVQSLSSGPRFVLDKS